MARNGSDGSGIKNGTQPADKIGPGQDGFNYPSHVTNYDNGEGNSHPQVGRDKAGATDPRGKGGTMGDDS